MNKKLQVFVSSTYLDLIEERQAAVEAILDAGHIPAGMELFKAGRSQMETIRRWIDESDVYMLVLGGRYGSIEEESGLSYTELEYNYAVSKNMPVFSVVLSENFLHAKASVSTTNVFEKDYIRKYKAFKKAVMSKIVKQVDSLPAIKTAIHSELNDILTNKSNNLIGWVKGNAGRTSLMDFELLSETLSKTVVYKTDDLKLNANELFLDNIYFFNQGIASSFFPNANILVRNGILEIIIDSKSKKEILKLSQTGSDYYNYLVVDKHMQPKEPVFAK